MAKEAKNNIRSFRYSDRVAEILEGTEGDSLNAKFENLVLFCYDRLPEIKKSYETYSSMADRQRREYWDMNDNIANLRSKLARMDRDLSNVSDMMQEVKAICNTFESQD